MSDPTVDRIVKKLYDDEPDTVRDQLAEALNEHRPSDDRSSAGTPMCACGHDLGWEETWPEHVAGLILSLL